MAMISRVCILISILLLIGACDDEGSQIIEDIIDSNGLVRFVLDTALVDTLIDVESFNSGVLGIEAAMPEESEFESIVGIVRIGEKNTTAIEGVHYEYKRQIFSLTPTNRYTAPILEIPKVEEEANVQIEFIIEVVSEAGDYILTNDSLLVELNFRGDLTGTYNVTNDFCTFIWPNVQMQISQAEDGIGWFLESADGYFLHGCTSSMGAPNWGYIYENLGVIAPTDSLRYGSLGIGTILGGTWDQETGTLIMQHEDTFFNGGPYYWTSTYVRIED